MGSFNDDLREVTYEKGKGFKINSPKDIKNKVINLLPKVDKYIDEEPENIVLQSPPIDHNFAALLSNETLDL